MGDEGIYIGRELERKKGNSQERVEKEVVICKM